jgi:uncharacterized repeat protein (TIGR01451 family)
MVSALARVLPIWLTVLLTLLALAAPPAYATPAPDLTISKSHFGAFFVGAGAASYGVSVSNAGAGPTTGTVTVTDTLPTGMTYRSINAPANGWSCSGTTTVTCTNPGPIVGGRLRRRRGEGEHHAVGGRHPHQHGDGLHAGRDRQL